jgi:hypothetical protein
MPDMFLGDAGLLSESAVAGAIGTLGVEPESLWALLAVETRGFGYLPDRRLKLLFERHIFSKRTGRAFDASNPDISSPSPGGDVGNAGEYGRLAVAMNLNRTASLESASWGLPQIMGFNAAGLGYQGAEDMIAQFRDGEDAQLDGCVRFIRANIDLAAAFRDREWSTVAFYYNGKNFAEGGYHLKLAQQYDLYKARGVPDVNLRAAQARLTFLGFNPRGVDGLDGPGTQAALVAFQKQQGLPQTGRLDDTTRQRLVATAGV